MQHVFPDKLLPLRKNVIYKKKRKKITCVYVDFSGYDSKKGLNVDYLRVDPKGFAYCMKYMDGKENIVIKDKKICINFDFEFDNGPFTETLHAQSARGFTRASLAQSVFEKYTELFKQANKKRWVKDIKTIAVKQIYLNNDDGVYAIDVDIN